MSREEHEVHLRKALQVLREHQLYAKFSKSEFRLRLVTFLSNVVTDQGVEVDPKKVEAVKMSHPGLPPRRNRLSFPF